ncbi:hypothetical protein HN011_001850 [Eciton burchellii]|nr:hypothetical protein HN011_001850 [Eciton burchellii]
MAGTSHEISHNWDEFFMEVAVLYSKLSSGSCGNVGACIVNNKNRIVGCGYNEMRNNDANKNKKVYHAEINAINDKILNDLNGCMIYVTSFPCKKCTHEIIESGITTIIYQGESWTKNKKKTKEDRRVTYRKLNKTQRY